MTDAPFQRILDSARARLPGAMTGSIQQELYNVIKEFCERTNVWQEAIPFTTHPNDHSYRITASSPAALITRLLWIEGTRHGSHETTFTPGIMYNGSLEMTGVSSTILHLPHGTGAGDVWRAHVALTITDPSGPTGLPQIPDWIIDKYYDAILNGVVANMMMQGAKPYSNLQGAQFHGRKFRDGMTKARAETAHRYQRGGQAWAFPRAFRTRSQVF